MAKMFLDGVGVAYETVLVEENEQLAIDLGIKEAPTLVLMTHDGVKKIANPSNIKAFCEKMALNN